jgi:hypothetical protein
MYVVTGKEKVELFYGEIIAPLVGAEGLGHARVHNQIRSALSPTRQTQATTNVCVKIGIAYYPIQAEFRLDIFSSN